MSNKILILLGVFSLTIFLSLSFVSATHVTGHDGYPIDRYISSGGGSGSETHSYPCNDPPDGGIGSSTYDESISVSMSFKKYNDIGWEGSGSATTSGDNDATCPNDCSKSNTASNTFTATYTCIAGACTKRSTGSWSTPDGCSDPSEPASGSYDYTTSIDFPPEYLPGIESGGICDGNEPGKVTTSRTKSNCIDSWDETYSVGESYDDPVFGMSCGYTADFSSTRGYCEFYDPSLIDGGELDYGDTTYPDITDDYTCDFIELMYDDIPYDNREYFVPRPEDARHNCYDDGSRIRSKCCGSPGPVPSYGGVGSHVGYVTFACNCAENDANIWVIPEGSGSTAEAPVSGEWIAADAIQSNSKSDSWPTLQLIKISGQSAWAVTCGVGLLGFEMRLVDRTAIGTIWGIGTGIPLGIAYLHPNHPDWASFYARAATGTSDPQCE